MPEQVLVFDSRLIDGWEQHAPDGILTEPALVRRYADLVIDSRELFYADRDRAETNPDYKQLIPYVVIRCQQGLFFNYERTKRGGEKRLHGLRSLGVGGHINPKDDTDADLFAYTVGFFRELHEETGLLFKDSRLARASVRGFIYDDSDEVGRVHFGVVHVIDVSVAHVMRFDDPALARGQFASYETLRSKRHEFESWSRLVIDHLLPGISA